MNESNDIMNQIATYYNSIRIVQQIYFFIFLIIFYIFKSMKSSIFFPSEEGQEIIKDYDISMLLILILLCIDRLLSMQIFWKFLYIG